MAVTWNWNRKHGEVFIKQRHGEKWYTFKCNIYFGNCALVILWEYKDQETNKDMYRFVNFFNDLQHLKNCLGQSRSHKENILCTNDEKWSKVRFNTFWWKDSTHTRKNDMLMIQALTKAGIKVELYYKEVK